MTALERLYNDIKNLEWTKTMPKLVAQREQLEDLKRELDRQLRETKSEIQELDALLLDRLASEPDLKIKGENYTIVGFCSETLRPIDRDQTMQFLYENHPEALQISLRTLESLAHENPAVTSLLLAEPSVKISLRKNK